MVLGMEVLTPAMIISYLFFNNSVCVHFIVTSDICLSKLGAITTVPFLKDIFSNHALQHCSMLAEITYDSNRVNVYFFCIHGHKVQLVHLLMKSSVLIFLFCLQPVSCALGSFVQVCQAILVCCIEKKSPVYILYY